MLSMQPFYSFFKSKFTFCSGNNQIRFPKYPITLIIKSKISLPSYRANTFHNTNFIALILGLILTEGEAGETWEPSDKFTLFLFSPPEIKLLSQSPHS